MHTAAIIAEFNPFHNGHRYLIDAARAQGAEAIVIIMSGNFVQRGEPALFDKFLRARAALLCGADLVLELPLAYATAGAQRFAQGAVSIAAALGTVDALFFGSECGNTALLSRTLQALSDERVLKRMRIFLKEGETFASARAQAVGVLYGTTARTVLSGPNDTLALEYMAALQRLGESGCAIAPHAVRRHAAGHHEQSPNGRYCSASYLRQLAAGEGIGALEPYVPAPAFSLYRTAPIVTPGAMELPMLSRLRALQPQDLESLPEVSEGLHYRLFHAAREAVSQKELYALTKSKRYTHARVRRLALHAFLGVEDALSTAPPPYLRILGFNGRGRSLIPKGPRQTPVNASLRQLESLGEMARRFARLEASASDQYALMQTPRGTCAADYTTPLVRLNL